jgi:hypothetical protein
MIGTFDIFGRFGTIVSTGASGISALMLAASADRRLVHRLSGARKRPADRRHLAPPLAAGSRERESAAKWTSKMTHHQII